MLLFWELPLASRVRHDITFQDSTNFTYLRKEVLVLQEKACFNDGASVPSNQLPPTWFDGRLLPVSITIENGSTWQREVERSIGRWQSSTQWKGGRYPRELWWYQVVKQPRRRRRNQRHNRFQPSIFHSILSKCDGESLQYKHKGCRYHTFVYQGRAWKEGISSSVEIMDVFSAYVGWTRQDNKSFAVHSSVSRILVCWKEQ